MNTTKLAYIIEIARVESLSKAAKNLYISQSALSQAISELETEYQIIIFNRTKKGTFPTVEGKKIIAKSREVIDKVNELELLFNRSKENWKFKIAAIPGVMPQLVLGVSKFKKKHENATIYLSEKDSKQIVQDIKEKKSI